MTMLNCAEAGGLCTKAVVGVRKQASTMAFSPQSQPILPQPMVFPRRNAPGNLLLHWSNVRNTLLAWHTVLQRVGASDVDGAGSRSVWHGSACCRQRGRTGNYKFHRARRRDRAQNSSEN